MATRWEVTKAVRASDLPAPSRLVMFVLADVAEVGTAEIPARFTPSLRVLASETGLDRSTVKRHLASLEAAGWVVVSRPAAAAQWHGERNRYRLDCPGGAVPPGVGAQDATLGAEDTQGGGTEHPGVGAQNTPPGGAVRPLIRSTDQGQITSDRPSSPTKDPATPERLDVDQICRHLADRIEANGSKRPTITKTWRDAARRLIDRDGRTVEQIVRCVDWCQDDDFWRSNILSMPKLREKYDQLRLAAARAKPSSNGHQPYRNRDNARAYHEETL